MTENELKGLWEKYHLPRHIAAHMRRVAEVCAFIGEKINSRGGRGGKVDLELLRRAALLHDLVKICDFAELDLSGFDGFNGEDVRFWSALIKACHADGHIKAVCNILSDLGETAIAEVIKKHRFTCLLDPDPAERPVSLEEKVLYYADKRVRHDRIVSIADRLEDGRRRYFPDGNITDTDAGVGKELYKLESELCGLAGIGPEDISEKSLQEE